MNLPFVSRYESRFTYSDGELDDYLSANGGKYPPRLVDLPAPLETMPDPAGEYDEVMRDIKDNYVPPVEVIQTPDFLQRIIETLAENEMLGLLQRGTDYPKEPLIDQVHLRPIAEFLYETGLKGGRCLLERAKRAAEEQAEQGDETVMEIN